MRKLDFNRTNLLFTLKRGAVGEAAPHTLLVQIQSLPLPIEAGHDVVANESRYVLLVPPVCEMSTPTSPRDWVAAITAWLDPAKSSVTVNFNLPDKRFQLARFDTYTVALVKKGANSPAFEARVADNGHGDFVDQTFKSVPEGVYKITVTPNDAYRYINDKCQCYEIGESSQTARVCAGSCKSSETEYFSVSASTQNSRQRTADSEGAAKRAEGRAGAGRADVGVVAAAVLVSFAASGGVSRRPWAVCFKKTH